MTTLTPEMDALAMRMSVPLRIHNPMRFVAEGPDFIHGLAKTVDEATTLQQEGKVVEGFALEAWAAFLLAAGIGYDGYIVGPMGESMAGFLRQSRTERSEEALVRIGEELGIYKPVTYLNDIQQDDIAGSVWARAYDELRDGHRPSGMKQCFWAVCIRASEFDLSTTRVPAAVSQAARIYWAFAAGD